MFVIEPKSTVKSLAGIQAVISSAFLLLLIILRIQSSVNGFVPEWVLDLNFRHWSRTQLVPDSDGLLIFSLIIYFTFVLIKFGLAIYLWRSVPKDYICRNERRLTYWVWFTIGADLLGLCLLALLNYGGAYEVMLAKIFSIITCFVDIFSIGSVLWLRRVIRSHTFLSTMGYGHTSGPYATSGMGCEYNNPNHNLRPGGWVLPIFY